MDSILTSIKKMLGIEEDYTQFDPELIIFINSALGILFQLYVGDDKSEPFRIQDKTASWSDFISDDQIDTAKSYVFMKVKLLFDPPTSSTVLASYQELIKEFEWRSNIHAETP